MSAKLKILPKKNQSTDNDVNNTLLTQNQKIIETDNSIAPNKDNQVIVETQMEINKENQVIVETQIGIHTENQVIVTPQGIDTHNQVVVESPLIENQIEEKPVVFDNIKQTSIKEKELVYDNQITEEMMPEHQEFEGSPSMIFNIFDDELKIICIYKTLKGKGFWIYCKDNLSLIIKYALKNYGGSYSSKMNAWVYPLYMKYAVVHYLTDLSLQN